MERLQPMTSWLSTVDFLTFSSKLRSVSVKWSVSAHANRGVWKYYGYLPEHQLFCIQALSTQPSTFVMITASSMATCKVPQIINGPTSDSDFMTYCIHYVTCFSTPSYHLSAT